MSDLSDLTDVTPPRRLVPSTREVDTGGVSYAFEPLPTVPPEPRLALRERAAHLRDQLRPTGILDGQPGLPLLLLGLSAFFNSWDDQVFGVLGPEIRDDFGYDIAFLITIGSVVTVVSTLIAPITGYLADRLPRVRMLAVGNVVQNGSSVVIALSGGLPALTGARVLSGVGRAVAEPTAVPLLTDWYPLRTRARLISFVALVGGAGGLLGPLVAGGLGSLVGWRLTLTLLGAIATVVSALFFLLKEPVRGRLDRLAQGASDDVASRVQKPVTWSEGWRATARIGTVRRLWYATPFLAAAGGIQGALLSFYFADEFAVGSFGRGVIASIGVACGILVLPFAGPFGDRVLATSPGRVFTMFGGLMLLGAGSLVVLALSPFLLLSVLAALPLGVLATLILPALITLMSMVVPARLRAFGLATTAPWQLGGAVLTFLLVQTYQFTTIRAALFLLVPLNLIGAALIGTGGRTVERDIRAALAAALADEATRAAREQGGNKMIICRDVDVTYDQAQVLFNVDFDVEEGELVALLGTNGAGKSTLLRAICGIQEASNGAIFMDGEDITHRPPHQNAAGGVVFMPGGRAIFPSLTVEENLKAAAWMYREDREYVRKRTEEILEYFPILRERLQQQAGTMSGGEQQMVALGQAFLMRPRLLMIDELSLGLSPVIVEKLLDIVSRINAQGTTVILVEQSVNIALTLARRAVFMEKGEIRFDGPTEELLGRGDLLRSVFLGGATGGSSAFIASGGGLLRASRDEERERVLEVTDVHLSFGGHKALNGAHLHVDPGEVVGIIGPNGAGKTSLFDVISGYVKPDSGRVEVAGVDAEGLAPDARARLGLSRSFQSARLFPALTVEDNIAVALEQRVATKSLVAGALWLPVVRRSERRIRRRVEYLVDLLNLDAYAEKFVSDLSTGSRRMVDMACVMASEPKLLLLDEPSSGLAQSEVEVLGPVIRRLARESGCGVLVIDHDMPLMTVLSDRLIAMELGSVIVEGAPAEVAADRRVVESYLGASEAVISRSGAAFATALAAAGVGDAGSAPERKRAPRRARP